MFKSGFPPGGGGGGSYKQAGPRMSSRAEQCSQTPSVCKVREQGGREQSGQTHLAGRRESINSPALAIAGVSAAATAAAAARTPCI